MCPYRRDPAARFRNGIELAGAPESAPGIAPLWAPSFEALRRDEATREMVNLAPAMRHRVASRINAIRGCLNAEAFATDPRLARPPLDSAMRERLERCLECMQLVRRRLGRVEIGDSWERLVWEYEAVERACEAVERACEVADGLLEAAGASSSSGPTSGRS